VQQQPRVARGKADMGKGNSLTNEGDMPAKNGHWFDAKSSGGRHSYACVKAAENRSVGCGIVNDTANANLLAICHDIVVIGA
jgi:hypothetical protein